MLSHIKGLFRQRKERQQKKKFNNHFRRQQERQQEQVENELNKPDVNMRSYPPNTNATNNTTAAGGSNMLPIKKSTAIQQQQQRNIIAHNTNKNTFNTKKELSTDNMAVVGKEDDENEDAKSTATAADNLVNTLVEQDNKRRSQLLSYPGLERFAMIKKLGEYCIICLCTQNRVASFNYLTNISSYSGAFSNVYEARDLKTGKKVAIKVAQKKSNSDKVIIAYSFLVN